MIKINIIDLIVTSSIFHLLYIICVHLLKDTVTPSTHNTLLIIQIINSLIIIGMTFLVHIKAKKNKL